MSEDVERYLYIRSHRQPISDWPFYGIRGDFVGSGDKQAFLSSNYTFKTPEIFDDYVKQHART